MSGRRVLLLITLLAACSKDEVEPTQVMVVIDAESQVRKRTRDVDFEVRSGDGSDIEDWELRLKQSITPGNDLEWPLEVALVPRAGDAERVYLVIATARDAQGEQVAEVRAISGYQKGKTVTLLLLFEDSCLDRSESCDPEQTCRAGGCVDAHVDIFKLPKYERDDDGKPIATPFWREVDRADAAMGQDGGDASAGDAGDGGAGKDAAPPEVDCMRDRDCDDGDPCNGAERCSSGACEAGESFECPALEDDPCRANVCVNDDGEARCEAQAVREGESCREGDETSDPSTTCARDYVCTQGACEAQTVDTCEATEACQELGGCDADDGCVYEPKASGESCDDGDACTEGDQCDGQSFACSATPLACDDGVGCTVDSCSGGECAHDPSDTLCTKACQIGTCDMTADCQYVQEQNFNACDDQRPLTTPDFCYEGACVGGARNAPTASCALGTCGCSGFAGIKDLEPYGDAYIGLIDANRTGSGGCTNVPVTIVYDVALDALTPYTTDTIGGVLPQRGWDLDSGWALADSTLGELNPDNKTVDWINNSFSAPLATGVPAFTNFRGMERHYEGPLFGGTAHVWLWGSDSATPTTGRLVRCSWQTCAFFPCAAPTITCGYGSATAAAQYLGVVPYAQNGGNQTTYRGAVAALNRPTMPAGLPVRSIYSDGVSLGYTPTNAERDDSEGSWYGLLSFGFTRQSYVLAYGNGVTNLVLCTEWSPTPACTSNSKTTWWMPRCFRSTESGRRRSARWMASRCAASTPTSSKSCWTPRDAPAAQQAAARAQHQRVPMSW